MKNKPQTNYLPCKLTEAKRAPFGPHKISGVFLGILLIGSHSAMAANVTMTADDPGGTTSFDSAGKWDSLAAPASGNDYFTSTFKMRGLTTATFAGDSLTIDTGGALQGKMNGTLAFTNGAGLFLNGGMVYQANSFNSGSIFTIAGTITANADSTTFLGATSGESLAISGAIGGSGNLIIGGSPNSGSNISFVKFDAPNTVSGTVYVVSPSFIGDSTNRLLQLNHVNALQNATLELTGGSGFADLVSFSSASNTGTYNIGALSGAANQALTDTASTAVAISVGANNVSTTYSGILSGAGSLTKVGNETLTLSGSNTYTGATNVNAGTLEVNQASFGDASTIRIVSGATLNLATGGATDTVNVLIVGGVGMAPGLYRATNANGGDGEGTELAALTGDGKLDVLSVGYSGWAGSNVGGNASNVDTDLDGVTNGVEYFMNAAAGFTANPSVVTAGAVKTVTWTNGGNIPSAAYGSQFVVQTSPNLLNWTPVVSADPNLSNTNESVTYTITGAGSQFVRLVVTPD